MPWRRGKVHKARISGRLIAACLSFDTKPSSIHLGSTGEVRIYSKSLLNLSGLPKNHSVYIKTQIGYSQECYGDKWNQYTLNKNQWR